MGQTSNTERLPEVFRKLYLGATQHQSRQETTPPRSNGLLKPLGDMAAQISQRRPWTLQHLDALDAQLTPTALAGQTLS